MLLVGCIGCAPSLKKMPLESPRTPPAREPLVRVCLNDQPIRTTLQFLSPYHLKLEEAEYVLDEFIGPLDVQLDPRGVTIRNDRRYFSLPAPVRLVFRPRSPEARFLWNGNLYSGRLEIFLTGTEVLVINQLPLEVYVLGVVPFEVPSGQEEYRQAVSAQAVAARTYALYRLRREPRQKTFHLYADVRDQVYGGWGKVNPLVREAVARTRGEVLKSDQMAAYIQYHSTCGGYLEGLSRSNPDSAAWRPDREVNGDHCRISPVYRWIERRKVRTILDNLQRMKRVTPDQVHRWQQRGYFFQLRVVNRFPSGRVRAVAIRVDDQTFEVRDYQIRRALADASGRTLPSNFFILMTSPTRPEMFYVIGAGFGHGRGMCQWGALGMALSGADYRDILRFYFPDYTLRKVY